MAVNPELIRKLARITYDTKKQNDSMFSYGTVTSVSNGKRYVKMDGTDNLVPIDIATDAIENDRVLVRIENHKATVIGNLTTPASARTATGYLRFEESQDGDGGTLYVGRLDDNGDPDGTYVAITPIDMEIVKNNVTWAKLGESSTQFYVNGYEVAKYGADGIILKHDNKEVARFEGNGVILKQDDIEVARFTNTYADIRNGIRLIDDEGNTHEAIKMYPRTSDDYRIDIGTEECGEVRLYCQLINMIANYGVTINNPSSNNLYDALYVMTDNGPTDVIYYLDNKINNLQGGGSSITSILDYSTESGSCSNASVNSLKETTIEQTKQYIAFGWVKFNETTETCKYGVRRASIYVGSTNIWGQQIMPVTVSGNATILNVVTYIGLNSGTKVSLRAYQNSGSAIPIECRFKVIEIS